MQVILNADDFGRSASINAAVILAHHEGVLTSASLMVTGDALEEAVALARATPTLSVGLHVVAAGGRGGLAPPPKTPRVDSLGHFQGSPELIGMRYVLSRTAQEELARELAAQFERFAATGLRLSHVDGHMLMHVIPTVFDLLLPLAEQHGACGLRLPRDDFWLAVRYDRRQSATKAAWAIVFSLLCRRCLKRLAARRVNGRNPLTVTHRVYGLMQSGQMQEAYVVQVLRSLNVPTAELYFHPTIAPESETLGPNLGDLATLLSPTVRQVIQERGLRLATYPTLDEV